MYYRGTAVIPAGTNFVELTLPAYVDAIASEFTVNVTPVIDAATEYIPTLACSRVKQGKFKVFTATQTLLPCTFDYLVFGNRFPIQVEPKKTDVQVKGTGPYTWI